MPKRANSPTSIYTNLREDISSEDEDGGVPSSPPANSNANSNRSSANHATTRQPNGITSATARSVSIAGENEGLLRQRPNGASNTNSPDISPSASASSSRVGSASDLSSAVVTPGGTRHPTLLRKMSSYSLSAIRNMKRRVSLTPTSRENGIVLIVGFILATIVMYLVWESFGAKHVVYRVVRGKDRVLWRQKECGGDDNPCENEGET
ncbi:uncharacterized protein EV422DRAFT_534312 [Fimicolochytrium jonesii]|uniref:uncharacterized protein n=1 Tax=Fimicolochytrium jonesii TaxID=1396493 RepID=UPI0022FE3858|nr:uncharacterized protein EV422DRAFT_534312 [Fimicolochytrium jonesii]KAI8819318.1 hypothetical protein EV422DRAFT_534312 [Fimicolochytrium jonesii]